MKHFTLPKDGGLIEKNLPKGILHSYEKIRTEIYPDSTAASDVIADLVIDAIHEHEQNVSGRPFKLGLTTGASPVSLYKWLTRRYQEGKVSFKNVEVFSIDEYYPLKERRATGRNRRLFNELLDHVDVPAEQIHIPDATVPQEQVSEYCAEYERQIRGLDLLIMGVGERGQVAFNEAGATEKSRTRTVRLSYQSRKRQARNFGGDVKVGDDFIELLG